MSAYSDAVLALDPVGYWRLGETSGTNANDESSNNNDATYQANVTLNQTALVPSESDKAVRFTQTFPTLCKAQAPRIAAYEIASGLSIALWMNPQDHTIGTNRSPITYSTTDVDPWPWAFAFNGNINFPDKYVFATGHGATRHNLSSALDSIPAESGTGDEFPTGEVAFVVCTYDGTTKKMWKNGCLISYIDIALGDIDVYDTSNTLKFGMGPYGHDASYNWPGYLDEVAVFDTALTEAQIQNLYTIGDPEATLDGCLLPNPTCNLASTDEVLLVDATEHDITVTLFDGEELGPGPIRYIKRIDGSAFTVTIDPSPTTIDRQESMTLMPRDAVGLIVYESEWFTI